MKIKFKYRNKVKRTVGALLGIILLVPIQTKINSILSGRFWVGTLLLSILVYEYIYYYITRNKFIENGYYIVNDKEVVIYKNKREYRVKILDINKVFCFSSIQFWEEYLVLKIRAKKNNITIVSPDLDEDIKRERLYDIYNILKRNDMFVSREENEEEEYYELVKRQ